MRTKSCAARPASPSKRNNVSPAPAADFARSLPAIPQTGETDAAVPHDAKAGNWRRQKRVEIIAADFTETGGNRQVGEPLLGIAPVMMMPVIVLASQKHEGRNGRHNMPAGLLPREVRRDRDDQSGRGDRDAIRDEDPVGTARRVPGRVVEGRPRRGDQRPDRAQK
jgi:hypothetical protein